MKYKIDKNANTYLIEKLGAYFDEKELVKRGIYVHTLNIWKKDYGLKAIKLFGKWYYSKESLAKILKTADFKSLSYKPGRKKGRPPPDMIPVPRNKSYRTDLTP